VKSYNRTVLWGALLLLATLFLVACSGNQADSSSAATSALAQASGETPPTLPDFPIILYQGEDIVGAAAPSYTDLLGDKPLVLNYWASNCPPCRVEIPEFESVWQKYQDRVLFIGLDVGRFWGFGNQSDSKRELQELGVTYVAGTPETAEDALELKVLGLPSTLFITSDGTIQRKWVGVLNEAKLTEIVEELLDASLGPLKEK
jgi:thiol-disulfide isomerase/thioredoxin